MLTPNFLPSFPWSFVFKIKLKINNVEAIRLKVQDFQERLKILFTITVFFLIWQSEVNYIAIVFNQLRTKRRQSSNWLLCRANLTP